MSKKENNSSNKERKMSKKKTTIAIMYDFDKTLCTKDMQEYTFIPNVGLTPEEFWSDAVKLARKDKMDRVLAYMYLMIKRSNDAGKSIRRADFVKHGKKLRYYPGVEDWFGRINKFCEEMGVQVEHYILSSGLREIIEGSSIYKEFKEVYACEFYYDQNGVACWPKNAVNYTTKTQFPYRINKGVLDISNEKDLNEYTPEDERQIPFRNMIYIGDGLTDVPCMKLVKVNGGYSLAVHQRGKKCEVESLLTNQRVDFIAPADYKEGSKLDGIVKDIIGKIAKEDKLVRLNVKQKRDIKK